MSVLGIRLGCAGEGIDAHAGRFLELLQEGGITGDILFEDIFELYHELLPTIGWAPRPWNPVARELKKLLGGKKTYVWLESDDGAAHRLRVYRLPRDLARARTRGASGFGGPRQPGDGEGCINESGRQGRASRSGLKTSSVGAQCNACGCLVQGYDRHLC
jgi:hypothetical protein